jgi:hypothetical protein
MSIQASEHWVSPSIKKSDLTFPLSIEDKVRIFEDRVVGWQLSVGLGCYHTVAHGGFGALYITLSYFELFERYRQGSVDHWWAGQKFRDGFHEFAVSIGFDGDPNYDKVRDLLYEGARCGLYHVGTTSKRVFIAGKQPKMFDYDRTLARLVIDPDLLINAMIGHFKAYVAALRISTNTVQRANFEKKFDHDILPQLA